MGKRMYDTGIVQQMWYMELPPADKALWWQLHAMMDNAGVFEINERMLEVLFGEKVSRERIFGAFGGRIQPVPNHPDKGVFVDYVAWANGRGLSKSSPSQRSILARLEELGLSEEKLAAMSRKRNAPRPVPPPPPPPEPAPEKPKPKRQATPRFRPPKVEDVAAYIAEMGYAVDAQRWFDYYSANGWRVGKNPMKDWKAAVRTWTRPKDGGTANAGGRKHATSWRDADLAPTEASIL